ncbi:hypothetical protein BaRGS_00009560 [Batillaria attramentaria]|uniref:DSBA-like thioredoxin domain-containing protein n=1 Tax=Batillaria attramentaria TaxID=370345 RepID=A0ABD0LIN9_9CAEN
MATRPVVNVDVVSDVMCPWCWVGKRRLEGGMKSLEDKFQFRVRWLPYMLRPQAPPEGLPIPPQYRSGPRMEQIRQAGQEVGIEFTFKNTAFPSTLRAHALLDLAASKEGVDKQNDVAERLFKAYFTDGSMLTADDVVSIGSEAGFDAKEVRAFINSEDNLEAVRKAAEAWSMKGVEGVPLFYFNGQRMFSGAQSEDVFKRMLSMAAERFPAAQVSKT